MEKIFKNWGFLITSSIMGLVVALTIVRCGTTTSSTFTSYQQIERLARPAINEGLIISNANLNAFNEVPPSLDLSAAAAPVIADAAATLTALYAGTCYVYGAVAGLTPAQATAAGLKPGGVACQATGANIFSDGTATTLSTAFKTAAGTYVTAVAGYFLPDVMRIDTSGASGYNAATCNAGAAGSPLLCGGRKLDDDVMNITYSFLLAGQASPAALAGIFTGAFGANSATALQTGVTYNGVSNNSVLTPANLAIRRATSHYWRLSRTHQLLIEREDGGNHNIQESRAGDADTAFFFSHLWPSVEWELS